MRTTKKLLFTLGFIGAGMATFAQIQWKRSLGGSSGELCSKVLLCPDGYLVIGATASNNGDVSGNHGNDDYWAVKLDTAGTVLWQKTYGGTGIDIAYAACNTADHGYAIAGSTHSADGDVSLNHGGYDYWLIKIDSAGNLQWQKSFGGNYEDRADGVIQTFDGGYLVSGTSDSNNGDVTDHHGNSTDYWLVKTDANGNPQWKKSYGGNGSEYPARVKTLQTTGGEYFVSGCTLSQAGDADVLANHGFSDYWLLKLDAAGTILWQKSYGGTMCDYPACIERCPDGGFIIAGTVGSADGDIDDHLACSGCPGMGAGVNCMDYWVIKLDSLGAIQWKKSYGGSGYDHPTSICRTAGGSYILSGVTESNEINVSGMPGSRDLWILNIDSVGNTLWERSFGGSANDDFYGDIQPANDGGYILCCTSSSNDGDVSGNHGSSDIWIAKLDNTVGFSESKKTMDILAFPNPSCGSVCFSNLEKPCTIILSDVLGKEIKRINVLAGEQTISLDTKGLYLYRVVFSSGMTTNGKLLIE